MKLRLMTLFLGVFLFIPSFAQNDNTDDKRKYQFESLEDAVLVIAEKALEGIETAGEFVLENAPVVIQQYLNWKVVEHTFYIIIPILIFGMLYILLRFSTEKYIEKEVMYRDFNFLGRNIDTHNEVVPTLLMILMCADLIVMLIVFCINIMPILKIIISPYVYLIETVLNKL